MQLRVVWSSVMVECGVLFAVTGGVRQMLTWPAVSWDLMMKVSL